MSNFSLNETIITEDGNTYTGELRSIIGIPGLVCDGEGIIKYLNGGIYMGTFHLNKRSGDGTAVYADGSRYEGEWRADKREGQGELRAAKGFATIENGEVRMNENGGTNTASGKKNGRITTERNDGEESRSPNLRVSKDKVDHIESGGGYLYEGHWKDDAPDGMGILTDNCTKEKYTGMFAAGSRQGRGFLEFPDGSVYQGYFAHDAMEGFGSMKYSNGDTYIGEFSNSKMHGKGEYMFACNGDKIIGVFRDMVPVSGEIVKKGEGNKAYEAVFDPLSGIVKALIDKDTKERLVFSPDAAENSNKNDINDEPVNIKPLKNGKNDESTHSISSLGIQIFHGNKYMFMGNPLPEANWIKSNDSVTISSLSAYYTGGIINGKRGGYGTLTSDISTYMGDWVDGRREGQGILEMPTVTQLGPTLWGWRYKGDFKDDCFHGQGIMLLNKQGGKFIGNWEMGERAGHGREEVNDEVYVGNFEHDLRCGYGTLTLSNGVVVTSQFRNGQPEDEDGCVIQYPDGTIYKGGIHAGVRQGTGSITFPEGEAYEGEFKNGGKEGCGLASFPNGDSYEGEWKCDLMDGIGKYTLKDGTKYEGQMVKGCKHGTGVLHTKNGKYKAWYIVDALKKKVSID